MYSPKIEESMVKRLYALKVKYEEKGIKKPMTEIVKNALTEYISKAEQEIGSVGETTSP